MSVQRIRVASGVWGKDQGDRVHGWLERSGGKQTLQGDPKDCGGKWGLWVGLGGQAGLVEGEPVWKWEASFPTDPPPGLGAIFIPITPNFNCG